MFISAIVQCLDENFTLSIKISKKHKKKNYLDIVALFFTRDRYEIKSILDISTAYIMITVYLRHCKILKKKIYLNFSTSFPPRVRDLNAR